MNDILLGVAGLFVLAFPILFLVFAIAYRIHKIRHPEPPKQRKPAGPLSPGRARLYFVGIAILVGVGGVMIGSVAALLSYLVHLVFLFPVLIGVLIGRIIEDGLRIARIRKASQLVFLSVLAAVTIYGTYQYGRYIGLQVQTSLTIYSDFEQATSEKSLRVAKTLVDYALREETGHSGLIGYLLLKAKLGVSIGRAYRSSSMNLGPILTWLYWLMEFGLILGLPIYMGRKRLRMAYCEACGNWYGQEKHLGGTRAVNRSFLLDLITKKDFGELGRLMEKNAELPSLEVYMQGCEVCHKSQSHLIVRHAFQGRRGGLQFTDASTTVLQPQESSLLLSQLSFVGS